MRGKESKITHPEETHFIRTLWGSRILQVPFVGEVGIEIKRHKIVPEGGTPSDKALRRWHTISIYREPPAREEKSGWGEK